MFSLLLSESAGPDLTWILWLVLALFVVIVIIGWMVSNKEGDVAVVAPPHVEEKKEEALPITPDILKKLEGIGPKVESILNEAGISTYAELAKTEEAKLREILADAKLQMMNPSSWAEQAEIADKGDWDALEKLQDELQGGRRV